MLSNISIEKIVEDTKEIVCTCDDNFYYTNCNKNYAALFNTTPEMLKGRHILDVYPEFEKSVFYETIKHTIETGENISRIGYSNNLKSWLVCRMFKVEENYNVLLAHTVDGVQKSNYVSSYDALTSINNRFSLENELEKMDKSKQNYCLLLIDILKFKTINDSFGVTQGDMVLMEFAARLKKNLNKEAEIYRYNADQFAVLLKNNNEDYIGNIIESIHQSKKEHFVAQSNQIFIDLAVGYCTVNSFNQSFQEIITNAEMALIKAKKIKSKLAIKYDEKEANSEIKNKVVLANELRKALKEGKTNKDGKGLLLYYQRQVDCHDKKTCGAEVLIRWEHPTRGFIRTVRKTPSFRSGIKGLVL